MRAAVREMEHATKVSLVDIAEKIRPHNVALADALLEAGRAKGTTVDSPIFLTRYAFGDVIVEAGRTQSPCSARRVSPPCGVCDEIDTLFRNKPIPTAVVLNGSVEVFSEIGIADSESRINPLRVIHGGDIFGVYELLDGLLAESVAPRSMWSVSAGPRSIKIMIPRKNDELKGIVAKKLGIAINDEKWSKINASEWHLLRFLARKTPNVWQTEIALCPSEWFLGDKRADLQLRECLWQTAWIQSRTSREALSDEMALHELFGDAKKGIKMKLSEGNYFKTIKHLVAAMKGDLPVFVPIRKGASNDLFDGSVRDILQASVADVPGLGGRTPAILSADHLGDTRPIGYYSFTEPSIPFQIEKGKKSLLQDYLNPLQHLMNKLRENGDFEKVFQGGSVRLYGRRADEDKDENSLLDSGGFPLTDFLSASEINKGTLLSSTGVRFFSAYVRLERKQG